MLFWFVSYACGKRPVCECVRCVHASKKASRTCRRRRLLTTHRAASFLFSQQHQGNKQRATACLPAFLSTCLHIHCAITQVLDNVRTKPHTQTNTHIMCNHEEKTNIFARWQKAVSLLFSVLWTKTNKQSKRWNNRRTTTTKKQRKQANT